MAVGLIAAILNAPGGGVAGRLDGSVDSMTKAADSGDFAAMTLESLPNPMDIVPQPIGPTSGDGIDTAPVGPGIHPEAGTTDAPVFLGGDLLSDTEFSTLLDGANPGAGYGAGIETGNVNRTGTHIDGAGRGASGLPPTSMAGTTSIAASHILAVMSPSGTATDQRSRPASVPLPHGQPEHRPDGAIAATATRHDGGANGAWAGAISAKTPLPPSYVRQLPDPARMSAALADGTDMTTMIAGQPIALTTSTIPDSAGKPNAVSAWQTSVPLAPSENARPVLAPMPTLGHPVGPATDAVAENGRHILPPTHVYRGPVTDWAVVATLRDNFTPAATAPERALPELGQLSGQPETPAATVAPFMTVAPQGEPGHALYGQSRTEFHVAQHVTRQVTTEVAATQGKPTEILLDPEELGRVRLSLVTGDTSITVVIQTERPETADLMRRHIDQLAQEFRNIGYQDVSFSFGAEAGAKEKNAQTPGRTPDQGDNADHHLPAQLSPVRITGPGQLDLRL